VQGIAAASSSWTAPYGAWAYLVVFALMALPVGPAVHGAGKVSSHDQNGQSISAPLAGLAIAAARAALAIRYYRHRKAHRPLGDVASPGTSTSRG
jgi:hypothetical protein